MEKYFELPIVINNFSVFLIPVTNSIVNFSKVTDIFVFNVQGQLVAQATAVKQMDVSGLPHGIYFLKSPDGQTAKLVKL